MTYSVGNCVICNNLQYENENMRFLIFIEEHYGES
jgi:hypothetical protein